jgi:polyferredoxin
LVLLIVAGAMLWGLAFRSTFDINVLRDRSPLFVTLSDGSIRNGYTFKILNMTREPRAFTLTIGDIDGATMSVVGQETAGAVEAKFRVKPDTIGTYRVYVRTPREKVTAVSMPLAFVFTDTTRGEAMRYDTVFRGPAP